MSTTEVPEIMVWANLVVNVMAMAMVSFLTVRRWIVDQNLSRLLVVDLLASLCVASLVGGALFQAGFIERDPWMTIRLALGIGVLAGFAALILDQTL